MVKPLICISVALGSTNIAFADSQSVPNDYFDMTNWKITLPMDADHNGNVDEIQGEEILTYSHPNFFFLDQNNNLVFAAANKAMTTQNSSNPRSELRLMLRGLDDSIGTKDDGNNFSLAAYDNAENMASIGGKMEATLKVNHVARHAKYAQKYPVYSVVIGQVHANRNDTLIKSGTGFGHGNEPLKIFYKKFPEHSTGSVFWTYERNLPQADTNRMDIAYPVWGKTWESQEDPMQSGIKLEEEFSYTVDIDGNIMRLTFTSAGHEDVKYNVNLATNIDPFGNIDSLDNPKGYAQETLYFKAGAYGQCSTKDTVGFWYTACAGTGDFDVDKKAGDYNSVTFSKLLVTASSTTK